jgi:hypothetical protein
MFETYLASSELVFFWDGETIDKSMMYSDFEATLDGYVGLQGYAGDEKLAAYVQLDDYLKVKSVVLFTIGFDESGYAERSWNLPLRHMVEIAGRGPDLGGGPIRLVCRSQCSISWHAPKLWDPHMGSAQNTFVQIQQAADRAATRFSLRPSVGVAVPVMASYSPGATGGNDIPVLTDADVPMLTTAEPVAPSPEWELEREQLFARLGEQQLRITTLETDKNETIARLGLLHHQQLDILEAQNAKLLSQHQLMRSQHDAQREQVENLRQQLAGMARLEEGLAEERRLHEQQLAALMEEKVGEEAEAQKFRELMTQREKEFSAREQQLQTEFQLALDKRLNEEATSHRMQLDSFRAEITYRDATLANLSKELAEIRTNVAQREEMAADAFLHRLETLGMNFVVFHPGAGHLSVPIADLEKYVEAPLAYAAEKCLVSEERYRIWLAHYENPRCNAPLGDNKCCDARLIRIDSPTRFVSGQSDRCARHQAADSAIDNVLRFR